MNVKLIWNNNLPEAYWQILMFDHIRNKYVGIDVSYEELENCYSVDDVWRDALEMLCSAWFRTTGERYRPVAPKQELERWTVQLDNTIEGEVVRKEINATTEPL